MYKRILLTLDGSDLAEQALPHAVAQAQRFQAELILLKVIEPLGEKFSKRGAAFNRAEETIHDFASEYLERVAAGLHNQDIQFRVVMLEGRPYEEIIRFAESEQVDLIVICTRGHSGFSRWLMGSVAERVTRGVHIPVLLVRARKEVL